MGSDESHFNVSLVRLHSIRQCPVICIPQYSIRQFLSAQNSSVPHYLYPSIQYPSVFLCKEFVSAPLSVSLSTVSVSFSLHRIRQCHIICIPQYSIRQFFSAQYSSVPHYLHPSIQYPSVPLHSIRQCPIIYIPQYSIRRSSLRLQSTPSTSTNDPLMHPPYLPASSPLRIIIIIRSADFRVGSQNSAFLETSVSHLPLVSFDFFSFHIPSLPPSAPYGTRRNALGDVI